MAKLIIAQVDHSTGEDVGHSVARLYSLGAKNVQVLQSMTKKNRPGYMLFIDLPEDRVDEIAMFLGTELGIWGFHILESEHRHFDVAFVQKDLILTDGCRTENYAVKAKYISNNGRLMKIKIDYDQLADIQTRLASWGCSYSLDVLRGAIESRLRQDRDISSITLFAGRNENEWGTLRAD